MRFEWQLPSDSVTPASDSLFHFLLVGRVAFALADRGIYINVTPKYHYYRAKTLEGLDIELWRATRREAANHVGQEPEDVLVRQRRATTGPLHGVTRGASGEHVRGSDHLDVGDAWRFGYLLCNTSGGPYLRISHGFRTNASLQARGRSAPASLLEPETDVRSGLWMARPLALMNNIWPGRRGQLDFGFPVGLGDIIHLI